MSFRDIAQSRKTGKRLFWGLDKVQQRVCIIFLHIKLHSKKNEEKKNKKTKTKIRFHLRVDPLKCVSKGNVEMNDIRVDMAQYSTHLRGRGFIV